jgi:hypothetical protein
MSPGFGFTVTENTGGAVENPMNAMTQPKKSNFLLVGIYLGCHSVTQGYCFLYHRQQAHRHRIAGFEESP